MLKPCHLSRTTRLAILSPLVPSKLYPCKRKPAPPFAEFHPGQGYWARYHLDGQGEDYLRTDYAYLRAQYEYLRADYEYLRADYEHLRRPFHVSAEVPYTDVWTFDTVAYYPGKHPCEKPVSMLSHMIRTSTRPGNLVLDCFAGSGSTCLAAKQEGRHFLGIERHAPYVALATARVNQNPVDLHLLATPSGNLLPLASREYMPSSAEVEQASLWTGREAS
jgi:hypothetical protein